jgi:hypothetical protein
MMTLDVFIRQENISLYKKLLADHNISDGQRDLIGKMLAEEEAKLLDLFSPQGRETAKGLNLSPSVQPENPAWYLHRSGAPLRLGTGTVQRVLMEQPRPFDVGVAEAALPLSETERTGRSALNFRQRYLVAQILEPALRPSRMFSSKFLMMNRRHFVQ